MKGILGDLELVLRTSVSALKKRLFGWNHVTGLLVETSQGTFCVDIRDQVVGRALGREGGWGRDELNLLRRCVTPSSDVLVVGAHVGALAIPASRWVRSKQTRAVSSCWGGTSR